MNINELNRIKTINIEAELEGVEAGTGTFKEILDKVYSDEIIPIVNNAGAIIGISCNSHAANLLADNVAQAAFEKRYQCIDVMTYVLKSLELKARGCEVAECIEDESGVRVVLASGEVVVIKEHYVPEAEAAEGRCCCELPSSVDILYEDLLDSTYGEVTTDAVKAYLRDTYDHYLAGGYDGMNIEFDDECGVVSVTNIRWGRKR